jgi:hypothetical protein
MKNLYYLILLAASFSSFGQKGIPKYEIGHFVDFNEQLISGYYDFDYEPKKSLEVNYISSENFAAGYYYDKEGVKISGLLKYSLQDRSLTFRSIDVNSERTLKPGDCKGYVINVDTFSVVKNVEVFGVFGPRTSDHGEFAENIENIEGMKFYKFIATGSQGNYVQYIVQKPDGSESITFPSGNGKFRKIASEIFKDDIVLVADIEKGKYKADDIPSMLKIFKYGKLYKKNQNVFYNSSWDEVNDIKEASYYSKIESVQDSTFHLSYFFKNGFKIYDGNFTSFYPHKKRGEFDFYYPNGQMRKKVVYVDNKPKGAIEYFMNGNIHRIFYFSFGGEVIYSQINNEQGVGILKSRGVTIESFLDTFTGREITYEYVDQKLSNVYYTDLNGEKIFQLCERNAKLSEFKDLQKEVKDKLKYPAQSIENYSHGYALIKCIVEPTGLVSEVSLIKGVDTDCDAAIIDFMSCLKGRAYWKPGKVDGAYVRQEIILPVDFSILGQSSYKNHYYNFWMQNHMMQQQMMMNQQWMNQQILKVPTGRF